MRIRSLLAVVLALCLTFFTTACSGGNDANRGGSNVTYDDIRNTGKANDCPTIGDSARGSIPLVAGQKYELRGICMHPVQVYAKEEPKKLASRPNSLRAKFSPGTPPASMRCTAI